MSSMKIAHIAIWVMDLEAMRSFYVDRFGAVANDKYHNADKHFSSYFLSFDEGPSIELMHRTDISDVVLKQTIGFAHLALSVGSRQRVDQMTRELRESGVVVVGEPRTTGDGYYESVIKDPEGNLIEITI